jgi:hypothetical protein
MTINTCNLRKTKPSKPWDVKIDRSSPLGNIFHMAGEAQRDLVCNQYDVWLDNAMKDTTHKSVRAIKELNRLIQLYNKHGQLNLYCWCAPKRCHGESIRKAILKINRAYTTLE